MIIKASLVELIEQLLLVGLRSMHIMSDFGVGGISSCKARSSSSVFSLAS